MLCIAIVLISSIDDTTVDIQSDSDPEESDPQPPKPLDHTEIFQLNVGGEFIMTTRETLTKILQSTLGILFNGQWNDQLSKDSGGNIFFDFNPILFRHLLDQLQTIDTTKPIQLYPPSESSLVEPFNKMIRKLGLQQSLSSVKKDVITFNVGGEKITNRRATFIPASNSTFDAIVSPTKMMKLNNDSDVLIDYDPKLFQHLINQLRKESLQSIFSSGLSSVKERTSFEKMLIDLNIFVVKPSTTKRTRTVTKTNTPTTSTSTVTTIRTTTSTSTVTTSIITTSAMPYSKSV